MSVPISSTIKRTLVAILHLACDLAIGAAVIIGFWTLEQLILWLWGSDTPMLFGVLPLKYVFHGIDLAVLLVVGVLSAMSISRILRG